MISLAGGWTRAVVTMGVAWWQGAVAKSPCCHLGRTWVGLESSTSFLCINLLFFSDPGSGRTSGNRGNIEKQVPRPSEEGHGARSGESDVGRCGQPRVCVESQLCRVRVQSHRSRSVSTYGAAAKSS